MVGFVLPFVAQSSRQAFRVGPGEAEENSRMDDILTDRRSDQAAENHGRHGVKNLSARLLATKNERDEADSRRQCGHEYGGQTLQASTDNHLFAEVLAFFSHQVKVVRHKQNSVSGRDST